MRNPSLRPPALESQSTARNRHCDGRSLRRRAGPSRTGPSIDRQYGLVQEDRTGAHLDVASRLEVLHHPADHLARGSDHLGDVLLGEFSCNHFLAVHGFRHFEQQARHSAVHVHQGEAADLLIGFSKPFDQSSHDRHGHLEVFGKASLEIALRETQHLASLEGYHACRPWMIIDQAHLSEKLVGSEDRKDHFASLVIAHHDLEPARYHHVKRLRYVARGNDGGPAGEALAAHHTGEERQLMLGQRRKQRDVAQKQHRYASRGRHLVYLPRNLILPAYLSRLANTASRCGSSRNRSTSASRARQSSDSTGL